MALAASRLRRWMVTAFVERWLGAGRRRDMTRCTPTDAFSNTGLLAANGPRGACARGTKGRSVCGALELGVSYAADCPLHRAYDSGANASRIMPSPQIRRT